MIPVWKPPKVPIGEPKPPLRGPLNEGEASCIICIPLIGDCIGDCICCSCAICRIGEPIGDRRFVGGEASSITGEADGVSCGTHARPSRSASDHDHHVVASRKARGIVASRLGIARDL
eukprot:5006714-Pyramimonas_sp.AAC.1